MNVTRTENVLALEGKPVDGRQRKRSFVPLTKQQFAFPGEVRPQSNWNTASSSLSKSSRHAKRRKVQTVTTSSSFRRSGVRNYTSRSKTATATVTTTGGDSATGSTVLAITTGRGEARCEVGIAALDLRYPHLVLCQISDSQTFANTLSKLYLFDPMEVLIPDTMYNPSGSKSVLCRRIMEKFPDLTVTSVSRVHFNDTVGLERIRSLCVTEYSSVELFVKQKYYALATAAALLKYIEYAQRVIYAPKSVRVEFQASPNATAIDLESARNLELVQSQCGEHNISLLGTMDRCLTPMGRKLLRANILQPPCEERVILERQAAVAELVTDRSLRVLIQPIVRRLYGADRLLALSIVSVVHESNVKTAEQNLNYILLLKNLLDNVPDLKGVLLNAESDLFRKIQKRLDSPDFRLIRERILETIHVEAKSVTGYTSTNMQRCFAIRAGINDLLDIARQTYCELIDDMKTMVENLAVKYNVSLHLACNATLGYHIQATISRNIDKDVYKPPEEFIEVQRSKHVYTMTTCALATLSQQCKIACEELHLMSDVLLRDLLESVRGYIGCLFKLSADVAELDLIVALAEISSPRVYVRPVFGKRLEILDSRHPIMEVFGFGGVVPNDIIASVPRNLCTVSGPNMSGKSTYLKQIVLLHIMAQMGCFVPAKKATLRITDRVFCKLALRDDIECNASTFALEMKEVQYILRFVTPTSLIVLDELCKGTATEEGASIAWAICETLMKTTAFIFSATHLFYLTKLADLYWNATNRHFETTCVSEGEAIEDYQDLGYTHRLKDGTLPDGDYGIRLAELCGLPSSVTEKARKYATDCRNVNRVTVMSQAWVKQCYDIAADLYELLEADQIDRGKVILLVRRLSDIWRKMFGEAAGTRNQENTPKETVTDASKKASNEGCTELERSTVLSKRSIDLPNEFSRPESTDRENICQKENTAVPHRSSRCPVPSFVEGSTKTSCLRNVGSQLEDSNQRFDHSQRCTTPDFLYNSLSSFSFATTKSKSITSEYEKLLLSSGSLKRARDGSFPKSSNSSFSLVNDVVISPSLTSASSTVRMSISSTIERSMTKLHQYRLTDADFLPRNVSSTSILTNRVNANTSNLEERN